MPRLTRLAIGLTVPLLALSSCAATELSTGPGGPTTSRVAVPGGTIIVGDEAGDRAASAIGAGIAITPDATDSSTTTTTFTTSTVKNGGGPTQPTIVVTTQPPVATTQNTPPPTQATIPRKPAPGSAGGANPGLSGEEQPIVDAINNFRVGKGLPALSVEKYATDLARSHAGQMALTGNQDLQFVNLIDEIKAAYLQLSAPQFKHVNDANTGPWAVANFAGPLSDSSFTFIGVGVTVQGSLQWVSIIVGS